MHDDVINPSFEDPNPAQADLSTSVHTPLLHLDPSPSPSIARTNTLSCQSASPIPDEIASGGPVNVNTGHKTPECEVLTRQTLENPKGALKNYPGKMKHWQAS